MEDPFNLQRFVTAQDRVWDQVRLELEEGDKRSHWMWFVFPQIAGLGRSPMAERYAISSLDEARAYLAHPVLAPRLRECVRLVNGQEGLTAHQIFGHPDDMKLRSCLTLFARAAPAEQAFSQALAKYYGGQEDPETLARI
jgi:uncharacterized protein (DUF1810 family)